MTDVIFEHISIISMQKRNIEVYKDVLALYGKEGVKLLMNFWEEDDLIMLEKEFKDYDKDSYKITRMKINKDKINFLEELKKLF
jgi:hypothetical protein